VCGGFCIVIPRNVPTRIRHLERMEHKSNKAGFKQQAEELHKRTVHNVTEYDWSRILNLDELGLREAAIELHEHSLEHAKYDAYGIIAMCDAGLDTQAQELHNATVRNVKVYDVISIIALLEADLERQADELHEYALRHAKKYDVHDIVDLYDAGRSTQAGELFKHTIGNAKKYDRKWHDRASSSQDGEGSG